MNKLKTLFLTISLAIMLIVPIGVKADTSKSFTDVPANHWAVETIRWGTDQSVTKGYPDGTFRPEATVTEAEFLAMLERSFVKDLTDGTPWHKPYYDLAATNNYPVTSTPDNVILRSQVAEIVAGTQGVNYTGDNAIQYLLGKGLAKGYDANVISIPNYHGADTLNRAQAVQFIKNLKDAGIQEIKARPFEPSPASELPALPAATNTEIVKYTDFRGRVWDATLYTNCTLPLDMGSTKVLSIEKVTMYGATFVKLTQTGTRFISIAKDTIQGVEVTPDGWGSGSVDGTNILNADGTYSCYYEITKTWDPSGYNKWVLSTNVTQAYAIDNPLKR